jgi:hypothetical protein
MVFWGFGIDICGAFLSEELEGLSEMDLVMIEQRI